MLGVPFQHFAHPHGVDFVAVALAGVIVRLHRHHRHHAFVQHAHHNILHKPPARLVQVCFEVQARIKARVDDRIKSAIFVEPYMLYRDGAAIHRDAVVYAGHKGAFVPPRQPHPVRPVTVPACIPSKVPGRVPVQKSVPGVLQPGTKTHFRFHFDFPSFKKGSLLGRAPS